MSDHALDLASTRWHELTQAYGSADDIPRLLAALADEQGERERAELWFGVTATLCPDGRVFTASYAAVPHLLLMTTAASLSERAVAVHVVTQVEMARHEPGAPTIPDDLVLAYAHAMESLPAIVNELATVPWDAPTAQVLAAALLVGKRHPVLARDMLRLGEARDER